jgi:hypothetical protein
MTERTVPEGLGDERGVLGGWLEYDRATLLAKCEGLSGEQLVTRSCEPSRMSLLGLVRHMTEMETGLRAPARRPGHRLAVLHRRERGRRFRGGGGGRGFG